MYPCLPRSGRHIFMHNVPPYISVSPCSQVLDTELDSHCIMLHFLLHKVFSHQIFFDIFHDCNILSILLLPLLIPLSCFIFLAIMIYLTFKYSPESFHWSIVNASSNSGHALYHFCGRQLCSKALARVLESTVTMEQRMYIGVLLNRFVKGVEHQFIIIAGSNFICHNPSVIEVKDCTEVQLVYLLAIIPLEFRHIGQPLLVRLVRMEIAVQNVLCGDFRDRWCVAVTLFAAYRL